MKKLIIGQMIWLLALTTTLAIDTGVLTVIPEPQQIDLQSGNFHFQSDTRIFTDLAAHDTAQFLAGPLRQATGWPFAIHTQIFSKTAPSGSILLTTKGASTNLGPEGYELSVSSAQIIIRAQSQTGLFYGVQTLLQLLPPEVFSSNVASGVDWQAPAVVITDWPRFQWRGLMLDVSRHFYTKAEVEKLLDAMALYKLNRFHWHLVDDQGWRIQIKKYPKLTDVGAWRATVGFGLPSNSATAYGPDGRYGGYYTQDDIREVVAYAAARHIMVVPEIEMPGHSLAALAAYPEYGTGGGPFSVPTRGGVNPGVYSPANDATFQFLDNVLTEVFQLFPSPYIHIGGDEVPGGPWKKDPANRALMEREGLKTPDELESWFIRRIEKFVNANNKTLIGWSEIARGGLAKNAVVMDWIGGGLEAASAGHDVVMTPTSNCYFDYCQSRDRAAEPLAIGGFISLQKVYDFEPIPATLPPEFDKHVLGAQGNLWTEYVANMNHAEYMIFPRECALAEVTWSARDARNYDDFLRRLKTNDQRLDELGINYRNPALGDGTLHGVKVGDWQPAQISTEPTSLEWDVTDKITAPGKVRVEFDYTKGADGIDITGAALLEDGQEISRDAHVGFTGGDPRDSVYTFTVPTLKPGAHYTLRAKIDGSGGTDSTGNVYLESKSGI